MKKRKTNKNAEKDNSKNTYKIYLFAFIGELVILCAVLSFFSLIIVKSGISNSIIPFLSILSFAISAFAAGYIAVRPKRKNGIATGFISAVPLMAISAALIVAINKGSISYIFIITIAVQVLCSMAGGITAANIRKKVK